MFEYLPQTENESAVTVIYAMEEVDEYTEEDILASIKGNKEIYEMKEEFSDIVYQEPVELSVGDKEAKYASLRCKKGEEYLNEYCGWYYTEDGFAINFVVLELRSADENYMVTEDTLKQLLEAIEE